MAAITAIILACLLAGCSTGKPHVNYEDPAIVFPTRTGSIERAGLFTGVLSTGKYSSYDYESLYCPGADVDMWDC